MEDLTVDIDIDIWRYGRNAATAGRLDNQMLQACYPYVEVDHRDYVKIANILRDNFEPNHNDIRPYLHRQSYVFFQTREDRHLFQGLLYIY